jgi:hypothetical protein
LPVNFIGDTLLFIIESFALKRKKKKRIMYAVYDFVHFQVVTEYRQRGLEFVLQAINQPTYLEDLTGLTELINSVGSCQLDWIDDDADNEQEIDDF